MGKEKKNNSVIVIILLVIIILILLALGVLFATGKITWNSNNNNVNDNVDDSNINDNSNNNDNGIISNNEAEEVVKNLFTNNAVRRIMDNGSLTYCSSSDNKIYTEKELGLDHTWNGYYKCSEFNSYDELVNYFKTFFTDSYYSNNLENKVTMTTKSIVMSDGTVMYNYYEKDGSLYYANTGKGSNMAKIELSNVSYNIINVTEAEIVANIHATWKDAGGYPYEETIDITLAKTDKGWKIDQYDVK